MRNNQASLPPDPKGIEPRTARIRVPARRDASSARPKLIRGHPRHPRFFFVLHGLTICAERKDSDSQQHETGINSNASFADFCAEGRKIEDTKIIVWSAMPIRHMQVEQRFSCVEFSLAPFFVLPTVVFFRAAQIVNLGKYDEEPRQDDRKNVHLQDGSSVHSCVFVSIRGPSSNKDLLPTNGTNFGRLEH
jgi:hypothetical protein